MTDFALTVEIALMQSHSAPPTAEAGQERSGATAATVGHVSSGLQRLCRGQTCGSPLMSTATKRVGSSARLHFNNRRL